MGFPESLKSFTLLDAKTTTGAGDTVMMPPGRKSFQITQSNSTATATTALQCSVDASNWVTVYTQTVAAAAGNNIVESDSDAPFWRGNIGAGAAGYSVSIKAKSWAEG